MTGCNARNIRPIKADVGQFAIEHRKKAEANWGADGGELINLPPDEQVSMLKTLSSVGADVSKAKPSLAEAYKVVSEAAQRLH